MAAGERPALPIAWAEVERRAPDVIVLDAIMQGMDGLAVARRLRAKGIGVSDLAPVGRDSVEPKYHFFQLLMNIDD